MCGSCRNPERACRYESHYEDSPLVLKTDGFYQVVFEKGSLLNYFDGRTFVSWTATD